MTRCPDPSPTLDGSVDYHPASDEGTANTPNRSYQTSFLGTGVVGVSGVGGSPARRHVPVFGGPSEDQGIQTRKDDFEDRLTFSEVLEIILRPIGRFATFVVETVSDTLLPDFEIKQEPRRADRPHRCKECGSVVFPSAQGGNHEFSIDQTT